MPQAAADHLEVRWRRSGTGEDWSRVYEVGVFGTVVVEGLERGQQYDFQVRSVSDCGAKSVWVPKNYTVPGPPSVPPPENPTLTGVPDGVKIEWNDPNFSGRGDLSYIIQRKPDLGSNWSIIGTVKTHVYVDPVDDASDYDYRIRSVDFNGNTSSWVLIGTGSASRVNTASHFFRQTSTPSGANIGDLWYNPNNGKLKRYNGITWQRVGMNVYRQASAPSNAEPGDLWYDTNSGEIKRYTGSSWEPVSVQTYSQSSAPSNPQPGALWYDTDTGTLKRWSGSAWLRASIHTYRQSTQPSNPNVGDLWRETDTSALWQWNGTAWVQMSTIGADWFTDLRNAPDSLQNLIFKPAFEDGTRGDWYAVAAGTTNLAVYHQTTTPTRTFSAYIKVNKTGGSNVGDIREPENTRVPVSPGMRIYRAGWLYCYTPASPDDVALLVEFYRADGSVIGHQGALYPGGATGWKYLHEIITTPPEAAMMLSGWVYLRSSATDFAVGPQRCSFYAAEVTRLKGGVNLGAGIASAYWGGYSLTATQNSITWPGSTLHVQGDQINYGSHTWSGLSMNTSYWLAMDDLNLDGTPEQYLISDTDYRIGAQSPNRILIPGTNPDKSVSTADSGGNGGGGDYDPPTEPCVSASMWILLESGEHKQARYIQRGDVLAAWWKGQRIPGGKPVLYDPAIEPADTITIEANDNILSCSTSTPFDLRNDGVEYAPLMHGHAVITPDGWQGCDVNEPPKTEDVCRISLGGYSYAAGAEPGKWIVSHNTYKP